MCSYYVVLTRAVFRRICPPVHVSNIYNTDRADANILRQSKTTRAIISRSFRDGGAPKHRGRVGRSRRNEPNIGKVEVSVRKCTRYVTSRLLDRVVNDYRRRSRPIVAATFSRETRMPAVRESSRRETAGTFVYIPTRVRPPK